MSNLQRILAFAFLGFTASGVAASLMDELSDKPVSQLLDVLESPDPEMRVAAAFSIQFRYLKPGGDVINPPTRKEQHPEFPPPPEAIPRLAEHLKSDPNDRVRIVAARALGALMCCTNTTSFVVTGLEDTNAYVRVWTCEALIQVSRDYSVPLNARVVPTLKECLSVNDPEEPTWIAAWISGQLKGRGLPLLPELKELSKHHKSSKVRHYAHEAVKSIQREKSKSE